MFRLDNSQFPSNLHVNVYVIGVCQHLARIKAVILTINVVLCSDMIVQLDTNFSHMSLWSLLESSNVVISVMFYGFFYWWVVLIDEMRIVYLVLLTDQPNDTVQRLEIRENKTEIVALALLNKHNPQRTARLPSRTVKCDWTTWHFLPNDWFNTGSITWKLSQLLPGWIPAIKGNQLRCKGSNFRKM